MRNSCSNSEITFTVLSVSFVVLTGVLSALFIAASNDGSKFSLIKYFF